MTPRAFQGRNERGDPISPARPQSFTLDAYTAVPGDWDAPLLRFKGYTKGQYWNGWACPYFPKATADELMAANNRLVDLEGGDENIRIRYDPNRDAYVGDDPHYPGDPYVWEREDLLTTDGTVRVYAIGAFGWIWDEAEDLTARCGCPGSDIDCGRTAVAGGLCPDCAGEACGHVHSVFSKGARA